MMSAEEATGAGIGDRCKELNPEGTCCILNIVAIVKDETGTKQADACSCPHRRPK